jgi:hypothetical protein
MAEFPAAAIQRRRLLRFGSHTDLSDITTPEPETQSLQSQKKETDDDRETDAGGLRRSRFSRRRRRRTMTEKLMLAAWLEAEAGAELLRRETIENREYLVYPVTFLAEGVHVGSDPDGTPRALYYPPEMLAALPEAWNGAILPVWHPDSQFTANTPEERNARAVGNLYNVVWDAANRRARGELYIEESRLDEVSPLLRGMLARGEQVEVSSGFWFDMIEQAGEWHGEHYEGIITRIVPDHVALLPGGRGACSWADSCGIRNEEPRLSWQAKLGKWMRGILAIGQRETWRRVQRQLDTMDRPGFVHWVEEIFDGNVLIMRVEGEGPSQPRFYRTDFSIDADDRVTVGENRTEVKKVVTYENVIAQPSAANAQDGDSGRASANDKEEGMSKAELVAAIIADEHTRFDEGCKVALMALDESVLERIKPVEQKNDEGAANPPATPATPATPDAAPASPPAATPDPEPTPPATLEETLAAAPPEVREVLEESIALRREQKEGLIGQILKATDLYAKEELENMNAADLRKIAQLAIVKKADFSGAAGPPAQTNEHGIPDAPNGWSMAMEAQKKSA